MAKISGESGCSPIAIATHIGFCKAPLRRLLHSGGVLRPLPIPAPVNRRSRRHGEGSDPVDLATFLLATLAALEMEGIRLEDL